MLKSMDEISPLSVPRADILSAVEGFFQRLAGDNALVPVENIVSSETGGSDLAFVKRDSRRLIIARLHHSENFSDFFLRTVAYQRWLKQCLHLSEAILGRAIGMEVYLISHDLPPAGGYLWKTISELSGFFIVKYRFLRIEALQTPLVRFELLHPKPHGKNRIEGNRKDNEASEVEEKPGPPFTEPGLSRAEIDEFNRLAARHL